MCCLRDLACVCFMPAVQHSCKSFIPVSYLFHTSFIPVSYEFHTQRDVQKLDCFIPLSLFHTSFIPVSYKFHSCFIPVSYPLLCITNKLNLYNFAYRIRGFVRAIMSICYGLLLLLEVELSGTPNHFPSSAHNNL